MQAALAGVGIDAYINDSAPGDNIMLEIAQVCRHVY